MKFSEIIREYVDLSFKGEPKIGWGSAVEKKAQAAYQDRLRELEEKLNNAVVSAIETELRLNKEKPNG